jgi:LysR family hydrogen peroxide-inducible transcriptional activator
MTLTQLSYIVAVAQHRHFGAAADACHITQPTLSMQIQKFEEEIGVVIFNRSQQPIRTTEIGEAIVAQARIVLAESQKIPDMISREINEISGPLSIGVIPTLSPYIIPLFIESLIKHHPKVQLSIEELQTGEMISRINSDSLDVGLLVTPLHNSQIVELPLFYEPFLVYVSPQHPLSKEKKIKETDLLLKDAWLLTEGHCFRDQVLNICGSRKNSPKGNLRFESGNLDTLRKMVDRGDGFTLLPWLAAQDLQPSAQKKIREFLAPVPIREVSMVHGTLFKKKAMIEAVFKEIQESLPEELQRDYSPKNKFQKRILIKTI